MEIPPLSERPVSQEEEEAFLRSIQPRRGLFGRRFIGPRRWRPAWAWRVRGGGASQSGEGDAVDSGSQSRDASFGGPGSGRGVAWLRADPVDWGIRIAVVLLIVAGCYAVYINGVAEGWWRAWGENPTTIPTRSATSGRAPTPTATGSSQAPMSGGYQVGPDGILVRPAEHAASTYTLPQLPQAATQNSERGAEAAAEHYLALLVYAWNTGDTTPFVDMSDSGDDFHQKLASKIRDTYSSGWTYDNRSTIDRILRVDPVDANDSDVPPNTISVAFLTTSSDGTTCQGQKITTNGSDYQTVVALLMTWRDNRWIVTEGTAVKPNA